MTQAAAHSISAQAAVHAREATGITTELTFLRALAPPLPREIPSRCCQFAPCDRHQCGGNAPFQSKNWPVAMDFNQLT
ncbi:hypothetical protein CKJ67_01650 [Mycobacterium intracellulare]|nr:hypothetical protein CKJ67_01650 [Mycobacterium intracellulare]PBA20459.1 hypothetical protein CKJ68_01710 [Mycobacterium intracellulare]PBA33486.1 hypothetical protein CKJ65_02190 [Mycobacterium intracellulare]